MEWLVLAGANASEKNKARQNVAQADIFVKPGLGLTALNLLAQCFEHHHSHGNRQVETPDATRDGLP
jgi:hypothetical protein